MVYYTKLIYQISHRYIHAGTYRLFNVISTVLALLKQCIMIMHAEKRFNKKQYFLIVSGV